jgi:fibronectin type 3 domain-containing protein
MAEEMHKFTFTTMLIIVLFTSVFLISPSIAAEYYVATNGSDSNPGTIGSPFLTIPTAISAASPGDTIYVRGGTYYYSTKISISKAGTSNAMYHLFAYPGERPILDFSAMAYDSSNRGVSLSGQYWHIKGLDIYKAGDNGMIIQGNYNRIEFCRFYENRDGGCQLANSAAYNEVINCDSYYNYDPPDGGDADGFSPKLTVGTGNYFYGCRAWNNSDDGYDAYLTTSDNVTTTYENCWAFKNGYLKDGSAGPGNGNGFKMGSDTNHHNAILKNCLSFQNLSKGFDQNHNKGSMTLYNCTAFNNVGNNYAINEALDSGYTLTLTNCVNFIGTISIWSSAIQTTCSWKSPFSVSVTDFVSTDYSAVTGPRKADGSLPDITFMHLAAGSDLIDGGTNVGLPYNGTKPDLGCFEYTVSAVDYPPAIPAGLSATGSNGSVALNWNDNTETDLDGYNVYRSTISGSGYSKINSTLIANSNYTDDTVTNNITYYYVVTALDVNGNESAYSSEASATPADTDAPMTPTGLAAKTSDSLAALTWAGNTETDLTGYNIYRTTTSGSGYIKLNSSLLTIPEYNDTSVTNTITYYYAVTAVDTSSNESAKSAEVTAIPTIYGDFLVNGIVELDDLAYFADMWLINDCTEPADLNADCRINFYEFSAFGNNWMIRLLDTTAPSAPTGLTNVSGNATVTLDWSDNTEGDLAGYNIYRSTTSGLGYSKVNTSLVTASAYTDTTVTNGTAYYYVVTAVDSSANESAYSSQISALPVAPITSITIQENTGGFCSVDGTIDNDNSGYTGTGFANTTNGIGYGVNWSVQILTAGSYTFTWRYSCTSLRPGNLLINGTTVLSSISFPVTSSFTTWTTVTSSPITLTAGVKTIRLESTTGGGLANIDNIKIDGTNLSTAACQ